VAVLVAAAAACVSCNRDPRADRETRPAAPAAAPALAFARAEWPGLTIEVVEVKRIGGMLAVQLRFTNASPQPFEFGTRFAADPADRDTLADVALVEPMGLRKYFVLRDRENRPACSTAVPALQPGERRLLFARFPAPREGTSRITIQIPHVADMRDVPIGR
jgi:hypothetical protein